MLNGMDPWIFLQILLWRGGGPLECTGTYHQQIIVLHYVHVPWTMFLLHYVRALEKAYALNYLIVCKKIVSQRLQTRNPVHPQI